MSSIATDQQKVLKTYDSCVTFEHLKCAIKLAALFEYKWANDEDLMMFILEVYEKHNRTIDRIDVIGIYVKDYKSQLN